MNKIIFLAHDDHENEEVRRTVRARAAEYSHRHGDRKPKVSKKPNARKRKTRQDGQNDEKSAPPSRRNSVISTANSATSTTKPIEMDAGLLLSRPQTPHLTRIGNQKEDSFEQYPVESQPWFGALLDYMWPFMLRGWGALDHTQEERQSALTWVQRLTMSNPSYFYMNMLSVSGDLVSRGALDRQMVLWHSSQVVKSINRALNDPERALSVGTILAVGRIALHEIMIGDMSAGNQFHRPAWARMIAMAGGLDALGLPPLVRSHLGWANRLMTMKTGINIFDLEPSLKNEPTFNVGRQVREDVAVLDKYMPKRENLKTTLAHRTADQRLHGMKQDHNGAPSNQ